MAIHQAYTYVIPEELNDTIQFGVRLEVPVKNKLYAGIAVEFPTEVDTLHKLKPVISVLDKHPIINRDQYELWQWMAKYYCCSLGEVMTAALPSGLKLSSETKVVLAAQEEIDINDLSEEEYLVYEALTIQKELTINDVKSILDRKTVYPLIRDLIDKRILFLKEELIQKYKPKMIPMVKLKDQWSREKDINEIFDLITRSEKQQRTLITYFDLSKNNNEVPESSIRAVVPNADSATFKALEKKGILERYKIQVGRFDYKEQFEELKPLSEQQEIAFEEIEKAHSIPKPVLLHGVTGSGKTRVYMESIKKAVDQGGQALYLLPEIALTTQIVQRIQAVFGKDVGVYHSKMGNHERVELWKDSLIGKKVIIGARSALLLPFQNLKLIIVDEEHDPSFKQQSPNPRYNARDVAIYIANKKKINIILGSATPSIESYVNAQNNRYQIVNMMERFGSVTMPKYEIVDLKYAHKTGRMKEMFSHRLLEKIQEKLDLKEQVILFQNRRGHTPVITCTTCGWKAQCKHCDITLTYHKYSNELRCHYCGYSTVKYTACPDCGSYEMKDMGFGTEKIAEFLTAYFPDASIDRFDHDNARTKKSYLDILDRFAERKIDILVGTQMIAKGLDFDNISLVGVINADSTFMFPDFRADERAFQLITQVSGRAGRRQKQGEVIIQTYSPTYPILKEVIEYDYQTFEQRMIEERKMWEYPPFVRMIILEINHKKYDKALQAANMMSNYLKKHFGNMVQGPIEPSVNRIKSAYIQNITIKCPRDLNTLSTIKETILIGAAKYKNISGLKTVRVKVNVDPY